jgi:hypothetical protein
MHHVAAVEKTSLQAVLAEALRRGGAKRREMPRPTSGLREVTIQHNIQSRTKRNQVALKTLSINTLSLDYPSKNEDNITLKH